MHLFTRYFGMRVVYMYNVVKLDIAFNLNSNSIVLQNYKLLYQYHSKVLKVCNLSHFSTAQYLIITPGRGGGGCGLRPCLEIGTSRTCRLTAIKVCACGALGCRLVWCTLVVRTRPNPCSCQNGKEKEVRCMLEHGNKMRQELSVLAT